MIHFLNLVPRKQRRVSLGRYTGDGNCAVKCAAKCAVKCAHRFIYRVFYGVFYDWGRILIFSGNIFCELLAED